MSETELLRLTFPDRGALEREIANNIRYGRIFVGEILRFPVLTDGVIVIVHPMHGLELKLLAQIVMVNPDGPMKGTGLALRAFGPAEVEQVEAFARDAGVAIATPRGAATPARSPERERGVTPADARSPLQPPAANPRSQPGAAEARRSEDDWSDLAEPPPRPASERFGRERTTGSLRQPGAAARGPGVAEGSRSDGQGQATRNIVNPTRPGDRGAPAHAPAARPRPATGDNPATRTGSDDFRREHDSQTHSPAARARPASEANHPARTGSDDLRREHDSQTHSPAARARPASEANRPARPGSDDLRREHDSPHAPAARPRPASGHNPATRSSDDARREHDSPAPRPRPASGHNPVTRSSDDARREHDSPAPRPRPASGHNPATRSGSDDARREHDSPHAPAARPRPASGSNPTTRTGGDDIRREHDPPAGPTRPGSSPHAAEARGRITGPFANRATEVDDATAFDPERTAAMPQPGTRGRSTTNLRAATEVNASPPTAARARSGSGVANPAVRSATEVIGTRAHVDRSSDAPGPQPSAAKAQPGSPVAIPPNRPIAPPVRTAVASSAAMRAPARPEDDWSDFEHGPEPQAAKLSDAVANENAAPTAPPPPSATFAGPGAPSAAAEDDWSDFEHGPEPSAAGPEPVTAAGPALPVIAAPPPPATDTTPTVPPTEAGTTPEEDWSDFEHGPEPATATQAAAAAQAAPPQAGAPTMPPPGAAAEPADDWSDFEDGPEPSGVPPAAAAELAPPSAAELDGEDSLVLPLGLGVEPLAADANNAVTIRPAPSDESMNELVERSRSSESPAPESNEEPATFDEDPNFEPEDARNPELQSANRQERLRTLNVVEQLKIARRGELTDRVLIERLYGKTVWEALLQNPRLTLPEVARIARKGTVPKPLLDVILENGNWLRDTSVRRALLSNPKITGESILKLLRLTPRHELKVMEKGNAYSMAVRDAVKKLLKE